MIKVLEVYGALLTFAYVQIRLYTPDYADQVT